MRILKAKIFDDDFRPSHVDIEVQNGIISSVSASQHTIAPSSDDMDARGLIVTPGFIDIQINGGLGHDFTAEPGFIWEVGTFLTRFGVTGFLPTIITSSFDSYQNAIAILKAGPPAGWQGAIPLGWHFEGPFLNPAKKGAHDPSCLHQPDRKFIQNWSRENGVMLVTLAPELPDANELINTLVAKGVVISAGHSMATLEEARLGVKNGLTAATHLFNAMPPLDHRSPGLAAAAMLDDQITLSLIADGMHVHPDMVNLAWKLKGSLGVTLITDAVGALGMKPGTYVQGGMEIVVDDKAARLHNGTLAGSILGLDQALRNVIQFTRSPIERVLPALSQTQSRLLHLDRNGAVRPGYKADLTFLTDDGHVEKTMVAGEIIP